MIDVNMKETEVGRIALHNASIEGHAEVVELLLQHQSIEVYMTETEGGCIALHNASINGHAEVV